VFAKSQHAWQDAENVCRFHPFSRRDEKAPAANRFPDIPAASRFLPLNSLFLPVTKTQQFRVVQLFCGLSCRRMRDNAALNCLARAVFVL
jgi:hypothetical protein